MATFEQFRNTFPEDSQEKGRDFEIFLCEWFLKEHPVYRSQFIKIWHFTDWPERWHGSDIGTDLIAKDIHGKICAIQAKFYHPSHSIPTTEIDSFLSDSNRKIVDYRLLIGTTDYYSANAANKIEGQEKPVQTFLLNEFLSWDIEWPESLASLNDFSPPKPKTPREHQRLAINDVVENLDSRGQLIMACGTGKTMTGLWIVEEIDASTTLVLLPSLLLLSQTMFEWKSNSKQPFYCLPVCSDEKVTVKKGNSGGDSINLSTSELCLKPTTDADEIASFMKLEGRKVIFSTYQSSPEIEKAFRSSDIKPFDLVIADEAHRCAGKPDSAYSTVLDDSLIPAERRLFMTATPRMYQSSFKKKASESGVEIVSMDDEAVFGPVLHRLSFGEAIEKDLLTDYQVVIVGVDNPSYLSMIEKRTLVKTETKIESDAQSFASHIGLAKAVKNYDLSRIISFHSRVSSAKDFAKKLPEVVDWMSDESKPDGEFITNYVSGKMPTNERNKNLRALADIADNQRYVLSNARCLAEGVDVPALDGVAFIDPRNSEIDIVQAVGRAIRRSKNKTKGSIVIPVFMKDNQDPNEVLSSSPFKKVWAVVNALRSHDESLSEQLDQLRFQLGKRGTVGKVNKIIFDLPKIITNKFETALATRLIESTTSSWEFWFGLLSKYRAKYGDCLVPSKFVTQSGNNLGGWVYTQRVKQNELSHDRFNRLIELGFDFDWDEFEERWKKGFSELLIYRKEFGNCLVRSKYVTNSGYRLGAWVLAQRSKKDKLSDKKINRLTEIGFDFDWNEFEERWEKGFSELLIYRKEFGNCLVRSGYVTNSGYRLGTWVLAQRNKKDKLSDNKINRLTEIGFDFDWNASEAMWRQGLEELLIYKKKYGDCAVPKKFFSSSGFDLGKWVSIRRAGKAKLSAERYKQLNDIGFIWSVLEFNWKQGITELSLYKNHNNNCLVPTNYVAPSGYELGRWVKVARQRKDEHSMEKRNQLNELGFVWDILDSQWETFFQELSAYKDEFGDCLVPSEFLTPSGNRLGKWIHRQRANKDKLSEAKVTRLNEIGFNFDWDAKKESWENGFKELCIYKKENGHCLMPSSYKTPAGYTLGRWVVNQRAKKQFLDAERIKRLTEQGFVWSPIEQIWEEGFAELCEYKKKYGNCLVHGGYVSPSGHKLGVWVHNQRGRHKLSAEKRYRLSELGFIWNTLDAHWEEGLIEMSSYRNQYGDCLVPKGFITSSGFKLGAWVLGLRRRKKTLDADKLSRLSELDFVWNLRERSWDRGYRELEIYKEEYGDCFVRTDYKTESGFNLGDWARFQRIYKDKLSNDRLSRLNEIGFVWNLLDRSWENGLEELHRFKEEFGHCSPSAKYQTSNGFKLGQWLSVQRRQYNRKKITQIQIEHLNKLGVVWDPIEDQYEKGWRELLIYQKTYGDCLVKSKYIAPSGHKLGQWVNTLRLRKEKLDLKKVTQLDSIGFVWNVLDFQWKRGFDALCTYKREYGNCGAPQSFVTNSGFHLGRWIHSQRQYKDALSDERMRCLNDIGFIWDPLDQQFENGLKELINYKNQFGDCLVKAEHVSSSGFRLGGWVRRVRSKQNALAVDYRNKLNEIGFIWKPK